MPRTVLVQLTREIEGMYQALWSLVIFLSGECMTQDADEVVKELMNGAAGFKDELCLILILPSDCPDWKSTTQLKIRCKYFRGQDLDDLLVLPGVGSEDFLPRFSLSLTDSLMQPQIYHPTN